MTTNDPLPLFLLYAVSNRDNCILLANENYDENCQYNVDVPGIA